MPRGVYPRKRGPVLSAARAADRLETLALFVRDCGRCDRAELASEVYRRSQRIARALRRTAAGMADSGIPRGAGSRVRVRNPEGRRGTLEP